MERLTLRDPELVVAIDVGTSYSGYAWQWRDDFKDNRSNVEFNTNWGAGALLLHKTKTCLLLHSRDKDFQESTEHCREANSFGHKAEERFCKEIDRDPNNVEKKWFFFEGFKSILYRAQRDLSTSKIEEYPVEDRYGQHFQIREVMTKFIRALKDHFLSNLKRRHRSVNLDKTLWVITVPQIWSESAKAFMRKCAEESGIKKSHLLLALEPDSAAIYCIHLPAQQRDKMNNLGQVGQRLLTADLGGGTVDISVTEVLDDGFLKEVCPGKGEQVGGQDINHAFAQTCTEVIEANVWHETFRAKNAWELLNFEKEFERIKVAIGTDSEERDEYISIAIPVEMQNKLKNKEACLKNTEEATFFKAVNGRLQVESKFIRENLFDVTVGKLTTAITKTMTAAGKLSAVICVGGFAESPIVIDKLRKAIEEQFPGVQLFVPTSPFRAVLYGAVLFGHDPFVFRSRVSKLTYGVKVSVPFDEKVHDKNKMWTNPNTGRSRWVGWPLFRSDVKQYCEDIFDIHVRKDQTIILNAHQPSQTYTPREYDQQHAYVTIFSSSEKEPKYTTDKGCTKLGEILVKMPDKTDRLSRKIEVTFLYGGTELAVTAKDLTTGKDFETHIRFDNV